MTDPNSGFWLSVQRKLLPRLGEALARFPLAIAGAAALTIFIILVTEDFQSWKDDFEFVLRVSGALACGALWSVSAVLIAEARGRSAGFGHVLGAVGAVIFVGLFWFHRELDVVEYGLTTSLIILVGLAPYLFRSRDNRAFWEFNHDVWIGAAFAMLAGVLLAAGISAILGTIEYLFKVDIREETWPEVWTVALMFVAPLYWLNTIPKRFDLQVAEGDQKDAELTTRLITVLAKFILVPLLLVYTAILYVYAAKIGIGWELPRGRLGYMVSSFGVVGIVTALVVFPSRNQAGPVVQFFWQHWFWLTLVPLALLFIGIWRRVGDYGLTQERYLLTLVGVWLLAVVVLFGLRFLSRDLRLIPATFVALLGAMSIGPWGLEGLPLRLLVSELRGLLQAENSLDANGVIKAKAALPTEREGKVGRRMASIVRYVQYANRLDRLRPLLGKEADALLGTDESDEAQRTRRYKTAKKVMDRLSIAAHRTAPSGRQYVHFRSLAAKQLAFPAGITLYGPLRFYSNKRANVTEFTDDDDVVSATIRDEVLEIKRTDTVIGRYALRPVAEKLSKGQDNKKRSFVMIEPVVGTGQVRVILLAFSGHFDVDDKLVVGSLDLWIATPPEG